MKMLVTKTALAASVALATLISAQAVSAQPLRHQTAPEAYDVQANPNGGFGPRVTVDRTTWSRATGWSAAIRTRSFAISSCGDTIQADVPTDRPPTLSHKPGLAPGFVRLAPGRTGLVIERVHCGRRYYDFVMSAITAIARKTAQDQSNRTDPTNS